MNNMTEFMRSFNSFRQQMQGQDPDAIIQQMVQSGRLSQGQYEQARQMAAQIQRMANLGAQR